MKHQTKENLQSCELYVDGMHCTGCELLLEKKLRKVQGVKSIHADRNSGKLEIKTEKNFDSKVLAKKFTQIVESDGYTVHTKPIKKRHINWEDFIFAIPLALVFIVIYFILQQTGIIKTDIKEANYPSLAFVGFVGSLSSCMAVTGGLVLSISANYAKESRKRDKIKAQMLFHIGRLVSFFILGGVIGMIGSLFKLTNTITFILGLIVGLIMLILGLNLLEIFSFTNKLQIKMPKRISHMVLKAENMQHFLTPALLGAVTFFLPCGFTQAAQSQALIPGNFTSGALTMLSFALGTLPVLVLISFASLNFSKSLKSGLFFKTAGIIVIFFAIVNIINAFVGKGILPTSFSI